LRDSKKFKPMKPYPEKEKMVAQEEQNQDITALLSDFSVSLRDIEEKQQLMRQRVLLIGENVIRIRENTEQELREIKSRLLALETELKEVKRVCSRVVEQLDSFARKSEIELLQKQAKLFQPLEFVKKKEIEDIIDNVVEKKLKEKLLKTVKD